MYAIHSAVFVFLLVSIGSTAHEQSNDKNVKCPSLLTDFVIWPCQCNDDEPTEFRCTGILVNDYTMDTMVRRLTKIHKKRGKELEKSLSQFESIRIAYTLMTKLDTTFFQHIPIENIYFDSNPLMKTIQLHSFNLHTHFRNFFIENMKNVSINE